MGTAGNLLDTNVIIDLNNLTIVTRDIEDFKKASGLTFVNPWGEETVRQP